MGNDPEPLFKKVDCIRVYVTGLGQGLQFYRDRLVANRISSDKAKYQTDDREMDNMDKQQILNYVAPCSLLCYTCPAYKEGAICHHAEQLCNYFVGYHDFMIDNIPPEYKHVPEKFAEFHKILLMQAQPKCDGCRNNPAPGCSIKGCIIPDCTKERGVNFCGECNEFPCENVNTGIYSQKVLDRWLRGNHRIKEVGVERFFNEESSKSHYLDFKKS